MLFDITLDIEPGQLYCANCSKAIRGYIESYLKEKPCDAIGVYADFRNNKVEIEGLSANDRASVEVLVSDLKEKIATNVGNDCINHTITTMDDATPEDKSMNVSEDYAREKLFLTLSVTLGGGITLMALEQTMGVLPTNESLKGQLTNAGIGIAITALTGFFGKDHFRNAWRTHGAMDTLISVGISSAIVYSFASIAAPSFFNTKNSSTYFSLPLVILGFLKLSHAMRDYVQDYINNQMALLDMHKKKLSKTAQVYGVPGEENDLLTAGYNEGALIDFGKLEPSVPVSQVRKGSIILVNKGDIIPIDGILLNNSSVLVQEAFYGKKGLTKKEKGSLVYAGSINTDDHDLFLETDCEAQDSYLRKACANVRKDESNHTILDWISRYFLGATLLAATSSALLWYFLGPEPALSYAIRVFLSVILSVCPCGLGLIDMNSSVVKTQLFKEGILIQQNHLLHLSKAKAVVFDKCGTLTSGKYEVSRLIGPANDADFDEQKYLAYIFALEQQIPENCRTAVAKAIFKMGLTRALPHYACSEFQENAMNRGAGGKAIIEGESVVFGNKGLLQNHHIPVDGQWMSSESDWASQGYLPIFLAVNNTIRALLILKSVEEEEQELRLNADWTIQWLIKNHKTVYIATGDTLDRSDFFLRKLSKNQDKIIVQARQTPQSKVDFINALQREGNDVFYIGDDENDRPVMKAAKYSAAIGPLTPVCDEAGAILNESLADLVVLMSLSQLYQQSYNASLILAFGINVIALFLSSGILYPVTHDLINPVITGTMMGGSSFLLMLSIAFFQWRESNAILNIRRQSNLQENPEAEKNRNCWQFCSFRTYTPIAEVSSSDLTNTQNSLELAHV